MHQPLIAASHGRLAGFAKELRENRRRSSCRAGGSSALRVSNILLDPIKRSGRATSEPPRLRNCQRRRKRDRKSTSTAVVRPKMSNPFAAIMPDKIRHCFSSTISPNPSVVNETSAKYTDVSAS